jgi:hypothetical protein
MERPGRWVFGGIGGGSWTGICIGEADLVGMGWRLCMLFALDLLMMVISRR